MGILSRAVHIGRSHLNSVVGLASNPQKLLRLVIQDIEDTLVKARSAAIASLTERRALERRVVKLRSEVADWESKAEGALAHGREDLASEALRARARNDLILDTLESQLEHLDQSLARQNEDMSNLQMKLQQAKARFQATQTLQRTATTRLWLRRKTYDHRVNNAITQLHQAENLLDELEGRVDSYDLGRTHELSGDLNQLAIEASVSASLSDMKKKLLQKSDNAT